MMKLVMKQDTDGTNDEQRSNDEQDEDETKDWMINCRSCIAWLRIIKSENCQSNDWIRLKSPKWK